MLFAISTVVLILIGLGWRFRREPKRHIPCMAAAFTIDLCLLLYIEITRHAVETLAKTIQTPRHHGLLLFHVSISTLTLVLYLVQIATGLALVRKRLSNPTIHRMTAYGFVTCRLLNYITSFFVTVH
jgi:uncharacterized membrane protein YozB (DUF420 family)